MELITKQLGELIAQQKNFNSQHENRFSEMQLQLDAIDLKVGRHRITPFSGDDVVESPGEKFTLERL